MNTLVYKSAAKLPFDAAALDDLTKRASERNSRLGITGFLYFRPGSGAFLQYLEGEPDPLEGLMRRIRADPRHRIESEIALPVAGAPRFPDWSMRRLLNNSIVGVRLEDVAAQVITSMAMRAYDEPTAVQRIGSILDRIAALGPID